MEGIFPNVTINQIVTDIYKFKSEIKPNYSKERDCQNTIIFFLLLWGFLNL